MLPFQENEGCVWEMGFRISSLHLQSFCLGKRENRLMDYGV